MPFVSKDSRKKHPICDPYADLRDPARSVDADPCISQKALAAFPESPWLPYAAFHTTGEFASLGKKYNRHCGPTAITNALCALWNRQAAAEKTSSTRVSAPGSEQASDPYPAPPTTVFEDVARMGQHRLLYVNMDLFRRIGGSSIFLFHLYLRLALHRFGFRTTKLKSRPLATRGSLLRELEAGHLLVLHLLFHPIYGSHEVVCYGLRTYEDDAGHRHPYLLLGDGWSPELRYLPLSRLGLFGYLSIQ